MDCLTCSNCRTDSHQKTLHYRTGYLSLSAQVRQVARRREARSEGPRRLVGPTAALLPSSAAEARSHWMEAARRLVVMSRDQRAAALARRDSRCCSAGCCCCCLPD